MTIDSINGVWRSTEEALSAAAPGGHSETELALRWLARAADRGMLNYPLLSSLDPFLEGLRCVSGFEGIMSAVRNQWEDVNGAADSSSAVTR